MRETKLFSGDPKMRQAGIDEWGIGMALLLLAIGTPSRKKNILTIILLLALTFYYFLIAFLTLFVPT